MKKLIAPSILSADFVNLQKAIELTNSSVADYLHIDVMDGVFVPNITIGFPVIKRIKEISNKPLDVHLMIVQPERYIKAFKEAGADILTVHYEGNHHLHRSIQEIKSYGMLAGVALNPHTPISVLDDILQDLDMVLLMSVNPGFGGQKFIPQTLDKIKRLRKIYDQKNPYGLIEVDGGVYTNNASELFKAGVNMLVAGNAVFGSDDPVETIKTLKNS